MKLTRVFLFNTLRGTVKTTVARLQPKEEVLLLGWGVPLPLPARRGHAGMMMRFGRSCWEGGEEVRGSEFEGVRILVPNEYGTIISL